MLFGFCGYGVDVRRERIGALSAERDVVDFGVARGQERGKGHWQVIREAGELSMYAIVGSGLRWAACWGRRVEVPGGSVVSGGLGT